MGQRVLLIGETKSGKTRSLKDLPADQTMIINVANKPLSWGGWKTKYKPYDKKTGEGNIIKIKDANHIQNFMIKVNSDFKHIKYLIVDDLQYVSAFKYFDKLKEKGYDKFVEIGKDLADIVTLPIYFRDDLHVIFTIHPDAEYDSMGRLIQVRAKTLGKMINQSLTLEGLFTTVIYSVAEFDDSDKKLKYYFQVHSRTGKDSCATPEGMFDQDLIPNDMFSFLNRAEEFENIG